MPDCLTAMHSTGAPGIGEASSEDQGSQKAVFMAEVSRTLTQIGLEAAVLEHPRVVRHYQCARRQQRLSSLQVCGEAEKTGRGDRQMWSVQLKSRSSLGKCICLDTAFRGNPGPTCQVLLRHTVQQQQIPSCECAQPTPLPLLPWCSHARYVFSTPSSSSSSQVLRAPYLSLPPANAKAYMTGTPWALRPAAAAPHGPVPQGPRRDGAVQTARHPTAHPPGYKGGTRGNTVGHERGMGHAVGGGSVPLTTVPLYYSESTHYGIRHSCVVVVWGVAACQTSHSAQRRRQRNEL